MNDNDNDERFFDAEPLDKDEFAATVEDPAGAPYEEIDEHLKEKQAYGEQAAKEHAKEALEELYSNEFPIDDPPESFERYEAEIALRHMRLAIRGMFGVGESVRPVEVNVTIDGEADPDGEVDWEAVSADELLELSAHAKQMIDVMATYGSLAESHIADLTYAGVPPEVREHAIETLAEMRDDSAESKSLTAAIRDWWHGE